MCNEIRSRERTKWRFRESTHVCTFVAHVRLFYLWIQYFKMLYVDKTFFVLKMNSFLGTLRSI